MTGPRSQSAEPLDIFGTASTGGRVLVKLPDVDNLDVHAFRSERHPGSRAGSGVTACFERLSQRAS